jgi:hypothetical protein
VIDVVEIMRECSQIPPDPVPDDPAEVKALVIDQILEFAPRPRFAVAAFLALPGAVVRPPAVRDREQPGH